MISKPILPVPLKAWYSLRIVVDLEILTLIGESGPSVSNSVSRVPVDLDISSIHSKLTRSVPKKPSAQLGRWTYGEPGSVGALEDSLVVGSNTSGDLVGGKTGLLVHTNSVALGTVGGLGVEVLGVGRAKDVKAVSVVGGDDDEGVVELPDLLEVLEGGADSVVEFEEVTKSTVDILSISLDLALADVADSPGRASPCRSGQPRT